ncbi:hypothetical protein ACUUL3_03710 [Thiovibrio sp. JS02]
MQVIINFLSKFPPLRRLRIAVKEKRLKKELLEWEQKGKPAPPPHLVKQNNLIECAQRHGLKILVESGTFYGDMVEAMKGAFDRVYSIELSEPLFKKAKERFRSQKHVEIIHGDSGKELAKLLPLLNKPALFWLDGHYSGGETALGEKETPIFEELRTILAMENLHHAIIIDDARLFGTDPGYPTREELFNFIHAQRSDVDITVKDDGIRITPKG